MRLAVFTPLPPVRSGIADYAVELLDGLGSRHQIQVYAASRDEVLSWSGRASRFTVHDAHEFVWTTHRSAHDRVIFQAGNSWCHDYMWPYVFRYRGLVVLHDAQLHHARAWSLLRRKRIADYRAELRFNHPELPPEGAEPAIHGFAGPLYYAWPMLRTVFSAAHRVAVHNPALASELRTAFPETLVDAIRMGVGRPVASAAQIAAIRARHDIPPGGLVVAAFGGVSEEKRIVPLLRAVAVARRYEPGLRAILVGPALPHFDAAAIAREIGVAGAVICTGHVPDEEVAAYLGAADIVSCLRWPSARETSASWLRAIGAGRPTIVTDLAQQTDLPTLDPRSWTVLDAAPEKTGRAPIAVSVDVMDEDHSLTLALKRLIADQTLRARLGAAAEAYWRANHTVEHMVEDYERLLSAPAPSGLATGRATGLPPHLRRDGLEHARSLLASFSDQISFPLP